MPPTNLADQVAFVTGAGSGFGRAIAEALAAIGCPVALMGRTLDKLAEVAASIERAGGRAIVTLGDVTVAGDVRRCVDAAVEQLGAPSVVVHSAGVNGPIGPSWENDPDVWWATQEVHVRGALLLCNALVPRMIERGGGRFIALASLAGTRVVPHLSGYCVSKASLIRFCEHLAAEAKVHGVFAFPIEPGTVITDLAEATIASPDAVRWLPGFVEHLKQRRASEDLAVGLRKCADFVLELASGRWDTLSGRYLAVDDDLAKLASAPPS